MERTYLNAGGFRRGECLGLSLSVHSGHGGHEAGECGGESDERGVELHSEEEDSGRRLLVPAASASLSTEFISNGDA